MNGEFWFAVFILLIGLSVHDVATWRRRRRVSNIERKRQIERMTQSSPSKLHFCINTPFSFIKSVPRFLIVFIFDSSRHQ